MSEIFLNFLSKDTMIPFSGSSAGFILSNKLLQGSGMSI